METTRFSVVNPDCGAGHSRSDGLPEFQGAAMTVYRWASSVSTCVWMWVLFSCVALSGYQGWLAGQKPRLNRADALLMQSIEASFVQAKTDILNNR